MTPTRKRVGLALLAGVGLLLAAPPSSASLIPNGGECSELVHLNCCLERGDDGCWWSCTIYLGLIGWCELLVIE